MKLIERLAGRTEERLSLAEWASYYTVNGNRYPLVNWANQPVPGVPSEAPPADFEAVVQQVYDRNGVVRACLTARRMLFSEARFKFRRYSDRSLFGDQRLSLVERPWPNGTTGDLLARMEQDDSLAGNAYLWRQRGRLHRLRPDWVHVVLGANEVDSAGDPYEVAHAPDVTVVGYVYLPGHMRYAPRTFLPSEIAHYTTDPDPLSHFVGRTWLRSVFSEIDTDRQLTDHKAGFLERGATPSFAVKYPPEAFRGEQGGEQAKAVVEEFQRRYEGVGNSWKALHLFNGADPVSLGTNFRDLDYKAVQGAGETRICAAARVPASVAGVSEGLAGSALNAGNFGQARRQFGEQYAYPSWRLACEALAPLVPVPADAELWYDTTDVAFLHEDAKDAAEVLSTQAQAIRTLTDGGYDPEVVVRAVVGGDLSILSHTGLVPVQLQAPGADVDPAQQARAVAELVQKIYLGVDVVLTPEEARAIANAAGANLPAGVDPRPAPISPTAQGTDNGAP